MKKSLLLSVLFCILIAFGIVSSVSSAKQQVLPESSPFRSKSFTSKLPAARSLRENCLISVYSSHFPTENRLNQVLNISWPFSSLQYSSFSVQRSGEGRSRF